MYKNVFILIVIFNLLNNCGFSPLLSDKNNPNFTISSINFEGDRTINNFIKINLNQFTKTAFEKKFIIEVNTKYEKKVLLKDRTAKVTDYELVSTSSFKVFSKNKVVKNLVFSEKKNMVNMNDKFEEQKYERVIKQNFASTMSNNLITELSILNDN
tara:strand:+ start:341 stop:808 length:468 start_codon:yes stop_codon:yes gene_type:complete